MLSFIFPFVAMENDLATIYNSDFFALKKYQPTIRNFWHYDYLFTFFDKNPHLHCQINL